MMERFTANGAVKSIQNSRWIPEQAAIRVMDSLPLSSEDLLLGAEPILFAFAGFATATFVQRIGALSYAVHYLCWESRLHGHHLIRRIALSKDRLLLLNRHHLPALPKG